MRKTISIVIYAFLFAAILCGMIILFMYIDNGEKKIYVQYSGNKIANNAENTVLQKDAISVFYCKNILGVTPEQEKVSAKDYAVTIQPDKKTLPDFAFTTDGETRLRFYDNDIDYNAGFNVYVCDGYFTVYMPSGYTMYEYLRHIYGDSVVGIGTELSDIKLYEKDCFKLIVRYIPDNSTITIGFH